MCTPSAREGSVCRCEYRGQPSCASTMCAGHRRSPRVQESAGAVAEARRVHRHPPLSLKFRRRGSGGGSAPAYCPSDAFCVVEDGGGFGLREHLQDVDAI